MGIAQSGLHTEEPERSSSNASVVETTLSVLVKEAGFESNQEYGQEADC